MFRPLVPLPNRRQVFDHLHCSVHPGRWAIRCIIRSRYVWRGLAKAVPGRATEYLNCQRQGAPPHATAATPHGSARATVLTYPCGFGGATASLGGCHLRVHGH
jgi:hypothetical protein